jgi:hypothetical protein
MVKTGDTRTHFGTPDRGKDAGSRPASGRVCDEPGCATVLSTYNSAGTCWMHGSPSTRHPLWEPKGRR